MPARNAARALLAMLAVMVDPRLAQNLAAKSPIPFLALPGIAGVALALLIVKGVRRGPHRHDGPARFDVIDDQFHLIIGQFAKTSEEHQQVRVRKCLLPGNIIPHVRIDRAVGRIDGE